MKSTVFTFIIFCFLAFISSNQAFSSNVSYTVKSGDTLKKIAKKYRSRLRKLKTLNDLSSTKLKKNQILVIEKDISPKKEKKDVIAAPPASKGANSCSKQFLKNDGEFIEYRPKKGDTLARIASKFNLDKEDILEANNITGKKLPKGHTYPENH
jgi:membrane-bound lytic murein transglycosylase D